MKIDQLFTNRFGIVDNDAECTKHRFTNLIRHSKTAVTTINQAGVDICYNRINKEFEISRDSVITQTLIDKIAKLEYTVNQRSSSPVPVSSEIPDIINDSSDTHNMSIDNDNIDANTTTESNNTDITPTTPVTLTPTASASKRPKKAARSRSVRARYKRYTAKGVKQKARDQVTVINFIKSIVGDDPDQISTILGDTVDRLDPDKTRKRPRPPVDDPADCIYSEAEREEVKRRRYRFSKEDKAVVVKFGRRCTSGKQRSQLARSLRRDAPKVYTHLTGKMVYRWLKQADTVKNRPGRKVNKEFLQAVLDQIAITVDREIVDVDTQDIIKYKEVLHSVSHSYRIVQSAAKKVRDRDIEKYKDDKSVMGLKFSSRWVSGFFRYIEFRRRRITSEKKEYPTLDEIIRTMKYCQDLILLGGYSAWQIINGDETGLTYAIGPTHSFTSRHQRRAESEIGTDNKDATD